MNIELTQPHAKSGRNRVRRRIGAIAASAGLLAIGLLGISPPAHAALSDCGSGKACVWSAYNYTNDFLQSWTLWSYCYDNFANSFQIDDLGSSFYNNGNSQTAYMYQFANASGPRISRPIKSGYPDLNTVFFNDRASSGYFSAYLGSVGTPTCS